MVGPGSYVGPWHVRTPINFLYTACFTTGYKDNYVHFVADLIRRYSQIQRHMIRKYHLKLFSNSNVFSDVKRYSSSEKDSSIKR